MKYALALLLLCHSVSAASLATLLIAAPSPATAGEGGRRPGEGRVINAFTGIPREDTRADVSRQLTAAADDLFVAEQKASATWRKARSNDGVDAVLYEDVLALLDAAISADPANLHARTLSAQVLLLKAYEGDGVYDVCRLLDARDDAEYVVNRSSTATAPDLAAARDILRQIRRIPPSAIPDPPSSCGEDDHDNATGKTSETR